MKYVVAFVVGVSLIAPSYASAQSASTTEDRPATLSIWGDSGLWLVPLAETLPAGRWAFSLARTETDFGQGFTDVSSWPLSVAAGIGGRGEIFGSWRIVTRVDRDTSPLFFPAPENEPGGVVNEFPTTGRSWSGNQLGDLLIGGKVALLSQKGGGPMAFGLRTTMKVPTADADEGVGSGKMDWFFDAIAGGEGKGIDVTGFAGWAWRGDPDGVALSDGARWGLGTSFPSRSRLRLNAEINGEWTFEDDVILLPAAVVGEDGTVAPTLSRNENPLNLSLGVTFQSHGGLFFDAGIVYAFNANRKDFFGDLANDLSDHSGDSIGMQFRVGWHGGVKAYAPPPPAVASAPVPEPAPAPNRQPSIDAQCDPCEVETGKAVSIRATASDPDGDMVRFRWTTPSGTVANQSAPESSWQAPTTPGAVTLTVSADDGRGGLATDTVTIMVREAAVGTSGAMRRIPFEDVHFDLDQNRLRPDAIAILSRVATAMSQDPSAQLQIEGHACDLGTGEYNLALSERRADAVREYLAGHGIGSSRISTVAYGEERPQNDNSTEELRSENRRAVLNVMAPQR